MSYSPLTLQSARSQSDEEDNSRTPRTISSTPLDLERNDAMRKTVETHTRFGSVLRNAYVHSSPHEGELTQGDVDPALAMKLLLRYVKVDPDGGILNLEDNLDEKYRQHSKIGALRKTTMEKGLAMFNLFRSIGNPCVVGYFALNMLRGYYLQADWIQKLESMTEGMRLPIPLTECCVVTALAELLSVLFLLQQAFRHGLKALCWSVEDMDHHLHPRYMSLATFYWHDLPYLQSFSALSALAFVHPNLLTKNVKTFSLGEDIARTKLERFLNAPDNVWNDATICRKVLGLIVNYDYKDDEILKEETVSEFFDSRPYEMLKLLRKSKIAKDRPHMQALGCDPDAIFGCRFHLYQWTERLALFIVASMALAAGSMGFITKLSRSFCLLMDKEVHWFVPLAFFFSFLNQAMGILAISRLLKWRIEVFMFGGADAVISSEEKFIMEVYRGSLACAVWKSKRLTWFEKMCVMFQLDDDDLQQLVIEDASGHKADVIQEIGKYMQDTGYHGTGSWVKDKLVAWSS